MKHPTKQKHATSALYVEISSELREALEEIRKRDGISLKAQLERAIVLWAKSKGLKVAA